MNMRKLAAVILVLVAFGVFAEARARRCVVAVNLVDGKVHATPIIHCAPGGVIRWMVINADDETYDVLFYDFKHGGNAQNPTNKPQHPHVVNPGQTNQVQGSRIRPPGDFGANLPFGTYKYSIRIRVRGSSTDLHVLDPELEVVEPTIIK